MHNLDVTPSISALCAGYEGGKWRSAQLAEHTMNWLPEFCFNFKELIQLQSGNALSMIKQAARMVYQTDKYGNRGEFGEIFLHIALRQVYQSVPVISKIFFKDSVNNTVKGFDAVHVVQNDEKWELWLGEVKFYDDYQGAIREVIKEISEHTKLDYLRNEKMLIANKLDEGHPFYEKLKEVLHQNTSLDVLFDCVCIPILVTYNSKVLSEHNKVTDDFKQQALEEVMSVRKYLEDKIPDGLSVKIHLFLIPLQDKKILIEELDNQLKGLQ
ncbi:DUF1837 domain-containing protein [Moraxella sp. ZY210820]|uniref:HamA C-terminal domain-containing protein n=1 Tax=Moraxella sp. ZY210820 TaxID=2904123 RepID=UPI00272F1EB3|nr:DUF1837 domain-containing protein [Moraxella sp. ZY210820]WLF83461.1 DUF1837 domain-containing protein [Moraxella sp. ZY210820]